MKRLRVLMLTVVFILSMALPAMAQGTQSKTPVQKSTYEGAMFFGNKDSFETFVNLSSYSEINGQYDLYFGKYNSNTDEYYYGSAVVPASEVVFNTTKGSVKVNKTVSVYKVEFVYDEETDSYTTNETYVGDETVNLSWAFNPKEFSTHKYQDRNIQIGYDQYLKLSKGTFKDYNNVAVTGNIGDSGIEDFEYSGANVSTGTGFDLIK
ncbi:hypothetical protein [Neobacillus sp. LXY-4]|uniref:hypothetical protein n=1 Tax=Neobacillus sp. LXY-4 TaxID=3379826 RepID=UPI003EE1819A